MEAIREVGPGQHFLGAQHTLANFETAFWASDTSDSNSFEQWEAEGSKDAAIRANERWKQILSDYRPPPLDDAIDHRLIEWMGERMGSFPDAAV